VDDVSSPCVLRDPARPSWVDRRERDPKLPNDTSVVVRHRIVACDENPLRCIPELAGERAEERFVLLPSHQKSEVAVAGRPRAFSSVATRLWMSASMISRAGSDTDQAASSYSRTTRHQATASSTSASLTS
jgi:hypothetical protein